MAYTLKVKNHNGYILNLTESKDYTVYKIEGLQPPQVTIASAKRSVSDGSTINRLSVENRNIVIYMTIEGNVEANRINLYKYFPLKQYVTIYFENGVRDVSIEGVVEVIECDLFTNRQVAQISLICPQPYFKSAEDLITHFSSIGSLFQFPFSIAEEGMEFSAIKTADRKAIVNTGDVENGIIIDLYAAGAVSKPTIYDVLNRTYIKLNCDLQPNDHIIINTNVDNKAITLIRNGESSNAMGYMSPDSKWLILNSGDNVFTYEAENGAENLQVTFTTALLYGGV